ncbi:hypothetical protein F5148DRAFT_1167117 [Russula earlei]|uniref:Uncharacterized protein n=1 Tax=Russula earlei TaxID=71964 RepID=A0ACC0ULE2_9AGAM|nr:hypothetical protein F5148DRAFT_1167117 [Russula earlei]
MVNSQTCTRGRLASTTRMGHVVQDQSVTRIATRIVPREDNAHDDGQEQQEQEQRQAPLGVELTGYRLLTTSVILGIGIPKAVYSYSGQALVSTTLDWVAGVILALVLYWLGVIEAERPESSPLFFQTDLAPPILNFLSRPEAQLWFLSIIPLLLSLTQLRAMLDPGRYDQNGIPAHLLKDGLTLAVLAFSVAIFNFCLQILRVVWPRGFKGTVHHFLLFAISNAMYMAYFVFMVCMTVIHDVRKTTHDPLPRLLCIILCGCIPSPLCLSPNEVMIIMEVSIALLLDRSLDPSPSGYV